MGYFFCSEIDQSISKLCTLWRTGQLLDAFRSATIEQLLRNHQIRLTYIALVGSHECCPRPIIDADYYAHLDKTHCLSHNYFIYLHENLLNIL